LTPACANLLEHMWSGLKPLKCTFNAENLLRRLFVFVYLQLFRRNSLLNSVSQHKIRKKSLKFLILRIQGCLRSLMLIALKSMSPVLVIIRSMSVPICNRFFTVGEAIAGKQKPLKINTSLSRPSLRATLHSGVQNFLTKNSSPWAR